GSPIELSTLLFIESMKLGSSLENDRGLRQSKALLDQTKPMVTIPEKDSLVALAFSPDSRYLATGGQDAVARVFETATGKPVYELSHPDAKLTFTALTYSPNGRYLAVSSADNSAIVFEAASKRAVLAWKQSTPLAIAFSPDEAYFASAGSDGSIKVIDLTG